MQLGRRRGKPYSAAVEIRPGSKIATEFPNITKKFFNDIGVQVEIIALRGAMEIAPRLGLAEAIVDLASTGATLEKNGLKQVGEILRSSARLICNKVSYKTKYGAVESLVGRLKEANA